MAFDGGGLQPFISTKSRSCEMENAKEALLKAKNRHDGNARDSQWLKLDARVDKVLFFYKVFGKLRFSAVIDK